VLFLHTQHSASNCLILFSLQSSLYIVNSSLCMGVDLHKKVGDHGQNISRMLIWGIRTVVSIYKNLHQANTVVSQYLNTYKTFPSNTDWNVTHNLHFKSGGGGTYPPVDPEIDAHEPTCSCQCSKSTWWVVYLVVLSSKWVVVS